jgi:hypothetical protein
LIVVLVKILGDEHASLAFFEVVLSVWIILLHFESGRFIAGASAAKNSNPYFSTVHGNPKGLLRLRKIPMRQKGWYPSQEQLEIFAANYPNFREWKKENSRLIAKFAAGFRICSQLGDYPKKTFRNLEVKCLLFVQEFFEPQRVTKGHEGFLGFPLCSFVAFVVESFLPKAGLSELGFFTRDLYGSKILITVGVVMRWINAKPKSHPTKGRLFGKAGFLLRLLPD